MNNPPYNRSQANLTSNDSSPFDHTELKHPENNASQTPAPPAMSVNQSSPPPPSSQKKVLGITIGACAAAGLLIAALILYLLWVRKRGKKKNIDTVRSYGNFSFEEMASATQGFSPNNIVGRGGFGVVYKGLLPNQMQVAIKRLKPGSAQGDSEFQNEVEIGSRVHHRNIVKFLGSCVYGVERMLIYEYVPNETLEHHLRSMYILYLILFLLTYFPLLITEV